MAQRNEVYDALDEQSIVGGIIFWFWPFFTLFLMMTSNDWLETYE